MYNERHPKRLFLRASAAALGLALASGSAWAADRQASERAGLFSGIVVGAVLGGPPGAVIGAVGGGLAGRAAADRADDHRQQAEIERLRTQVQRSEARAAALQQAGEAQWTASTVALQQPAPRPALALDSSVQFRTASAELEPHFGTQLRTLAALARQFPDVQVQLLGYADLRGSSEANRRLSAARVEAVRTALIEAGLPPECITHRALGESEPLYQTGDHEGRDFERRVLIRMASGGTTS